MSLNWRQGDYFRLLLEDDAKSYALEMLVDDLHRDKRNTVNAFLGHFGSEDFIWGLVRLLASENARTAGNAAYIFGTLAEHDVGQTRVLELINGPYPHHILADLTDMLAFDDPESVMNAAGTIGTLADSPAGREWILKESYCDKMVRKVTSLLNSENMWTASNAALVLARLAIAEEGCQRLLNHNSSLKILTKLIDSLGLDEAGRGMNAAFAIGRLCDTDEGQKRLLYHESSDRMIESLCHMLTGKDSGCSKNSCYALSCLAANNDGHKRLLDHKRSDMMLQLLANQLSNEEGETGWFAAMTLRTLASKRRGVLRLRDHPEVIPQIQATQMMLGIHEELKEEVNLTYELLKRLEKPEPPSLQVKGANDVEASWPEINLKSGQEVTYRLYCEDHLIYRGVASSHTATGLLANTQYEFKLAISTEGDDSPKSEGVFATTEESAPDPPEGLRILNATTSQLKLGWAPPTHNNGHLKGYMVFNGKQLVDTTTELNIIISGLTPATSYELFVCAINHKGKGQKASITARTVELGKHAPGKPSLTVLGRSEIQVTWAPPDNPLGRLHRFELTLNGKVIYSGRDLSYTVRRLTPDTEYIFTVIAITSEGKCESDPVKRRTPKDEYKVQSTAQRYFTHPTRPTETDSICKGKDRSATKSSRKSASTTKTEPWPQIMKPPRALSGIAYSNDSKSRPHSATSSRKSTSSSRRKSSGSIPNEKEKFSKLPSEINWPGVIFDQPGSDKENKVKNGLSKSKRTVDVMEHHLSNSPRGLDTNVQILVPSEGLGGGIVGNQSWFSSHKQKTGELGFEKVGQVLPLVHEDTAENSASSMNSVKRVSLRNGHYEDSYPTVHLVDNFSYDPSSITTGGKEVNRKGFPARRNPQLTSEFNRRSINSFLATVESETMQSLQDRLGKSKSSSHRHNLNKHNLTADTSLRKLSPALPHTVTNEASDAISFPSPIPLRVSAGGDENFKIFSHGMVLYEELKRKHSDRKSPRHKSKGGASLNQKVTKQVRNSPRLKTEEEENAVESGLYEEFASWFRDANLSDGDIDSDENVPASKTSSAKRKVTHSGKNPLAEPAIPSRSALADPNSFYQRTNTFLSSHRPRIKKNLSKLQGNYQLDLPTKRTSNSNRYQFVPTQFRTQPINMPGPPFQGGNRLAALQDKTLSSKSHPPPRVTPDRAFVRKLEVLSHLTEQNQGSTCQDCGRSKMLEGNSPLQSSAHVR
ncbi:Usherin [Holothuria leucospilota]|uniref:Usherin n=1 Tax=Holothuria leucospilota TaxID=206669 RepID=A0A9Q1C639_HOLLE|nr:Usherin [Holothuria leucospilota]